MRDYDTWYAIHLKVYTEKIEVWIDGEQVIDLATRGKQLSIRNDVNPSKPLWHLFVEDNLRVAEYLVEKVRIC